MNKKAEKIKLYLKLHAIVGMIGTAEWWWMRRTGGEHIVNYSM